MTAKNDGVFILIFVWSEAESKPAHEVWRHNESNFAKKKEKKKSRKTRDGVSDI